MTTRHGWYGQVTPLRGNVLPRVQIAGGVAAYLSLLTFAYVHIFSLRYDYLGYVHSSPPILVVLVAYTAALMPLVWLPLQYKRSSDVALWTLYLLVVVPICVVTPYMVGHLSLSALNLLVFYALIVVSFGALCATRRLPLLRMPEASLSSSSFWMVIALLSVLFYAIIFYSFGFELNWVGLSEVYETRAEYKEDLAEQGRIVAYPLGWQGFVLNPLIIAHGIQKRRWPFLMGGIAGQLVLFTITGLKSLLFSGLLIAVLYYATRDNGRHFGFTAIWGSTAGIFAALAIDVALGGDVVSSLLVRRHILTPGLLTGYYFDFFSANPHAYLGHSIFSGFVHYPYALSPPKVIGQIAMGTIQHANANIWADAFANFGYVGIPVFTVTFALYLWVYDSISSRVQIVVPGVLLGVPAYALSNSALLTSLLTHGLLFVLLIVWLMPRKNPAHKTSEEENRRNNSLAEL